MKNYKIKSNYDKVMDEYLRIGFSFMVTSGLISGSLILLELLEINFYDLKWNSWVVAIPFIIGASVILTSQDPSTSSPKYNL